MERVIQDIKDLKKLRSNWYDGKQGAVVKDSSWLIASIINCKSFFNWSQVSVYPTISGDVQLEWETISLDYSLEVLLDKKRVNVFVLAKTRDIDFCLEAIPLNTQVKFDNLFHFLSVVAL